jgi:hypothetical protein
MSCQEKQGRANEAEKKYGVSDRKAGFRSKINIIVKHDYRNTVRPHRLPLSWRAMNIILVVTKKRQIQLQIPIVVIGEVVL